MPYEVPTKARPDLLLAVAPGVIAGLKLSKIGNEAATWCLGALALGAVLAAVIDLFAPLAKTTKPGPALVVGFFAALIGIVGGNLLGTAVNYVQGF